MSLFRVVSNANFADESILFDPESLAAQLQIISLIERSDEAQQMRFDVKVTHPMHLSTTPREGVMTAGGAATVNLQLEKVQAIDTASLATTPMRVLITAWCNDATAGPQQQKMKIVCDTESIVRCVIAATRSPVSNNVAAIAVATNHASSSTSTVGIPSNVAAASPSASMLQRGKPVAPRVSTPPPVVERKASAAPTLLQPPPPPLPQQQQQTSVSLSSDVSAEGSRTPQQQRLPGNSGATEGAIVPVPSRNASLAPVVPPQPQSTSPLPGLTSPAAPHSTFTVEFKLHRVHLLNPPVVPSIPDSSTRRDTAALWCAVRWKRADRSGQTTLRRLSLSRDSDAAAAANDPTNLRHAQGSLEGESIILRNCEVSTEKRVVLTLQIVAADRADATDGSLVPCATLKLDTSKPGPADGSPAEFPLALDGVPSGTLTASLWMTTTTRSDAEGDREQRPPPPAATAPATTNPPIVMATREEVPQSLTSTATTATTTPLPASALPPQSPAAAAKAAAAASQWSSLSNLAALRTQLDSLSSSVSGRPPLSAAPTAASPNAFAAATDVTAMSPSSLGAALASPLSFAADGEVSTNPLRSFEQQMPKNSNVLVAVRIRPLLPFERQQDLEATWAVNKSSVRSVSNDRQYQFDVVFPPQARSKDVFDKLCPPFIQNALLGINGTIFMYGQTASGKTHTMFGSDTEAGLTPMVIEELFREIHAYQRDHRDAVVSVQASYFEIYNEELNDLLDVSRKNLQIRSSAVADAGFVVEVSQVPVTSAEGALQVLLHGSNNKKMGQSHLNDRSSRSHSIFKLVVEVATASPGGAAPSPAGADAPLGGRRKSKTGGSVLRTTAELCLVDLAGSETLQERSDSSARKETTNINLSLTYLKKVIWELAHKERHVSYRNSALTKVLKQSIGGNSRTCVVCCITPAEEHFRDSRNTLAFGTTAKSVVTTVRVNTAGGAAEVDKLKSEVARLRSQIDAYEATIQAYARIEDDFRHVLEENALLAEQIERLESSQLLPTGPQTPSASSSYLAGPPQSSRPKNQGAPVEEADASASGSTTTAAAARLSLPEAVGASSRASAALRADAQQHSELLEQAISRLAEVTVDEDDDDRAGGDQSLDALDERALDEDDLFDEVEDSQNNAEDSMTRATPGGEGNPKRASGGGSGKHLRPPAPRRRPPANPRAARHQAPIAAPRTVESLQLQLIQQTIDHRNELQRKDEEMRRLLEQQVRPTDEIPEIMKKEEKVCQLLDQLHTFLHHGTTMTMVHSADAAASVAVDAAQARLPKAAPRISRTFMYLYTHNQKDTYLCFCLVDPEDPKIPKRSSCFEKIPIKDIKRVELGQFGDSFEKLRVYNASNYDDPNRATPLDESQASHANLCRTVLERHRMSFTVVARKGRSFDCTCDDEADFEAWVIELNRLLGMSAEWKQKLDISGMEFYDVLEPEEQNFCSTMHIHPDEYIRAKTKLLRRKEKFVTLFDVRSLAQFDLYHSQRFFYFLRCQGWVSQAALFYLTDKFVSSVQADLDSL